MSREEQILSTGTNEPPRKQETSGENTQKEFLECLKNGSLHHASLIEEKGELSGDTVRDLAVQGFIFGLENRSVENAHAIAETFELPKELIENETKKHFLKYISVGLMKNAMILANRFEFPADFLSSPEVKSAYQKWHQEK